LFTRDGVNLNAADNEEAEEKDNANNGEVKGEVHTEEGVEKRE
jgi:hypothetical protein